MITILSDDKTYELGQAIFDRVRKNNNNTNFFNLHDINIKPKCIIRMYYEYYDKTA